MRKLQVCALGALLVASIAGLSAVRVRADAPAHTTTLSDQRSLTLTVYNAGLALVHDRRRVSLAGGDAALAWRDVSAQMQPETAILETLSGGPVAVTEQNFDFDVLTPEALLAKSVGHQVTIDHGDRRSNHPRIERATVLSVTGGVVLQYSDRIESFVDGVIEYSSIPPELRDRPTLTLDLSSRGAGERDLDLSYLTGAVGWTADYVGRISEDEKRMHLTGLVTMTNTSGTSFPNAHLLLVAGNVNIPPPPNVDQLRTIAATKSYNAREQFSEQSFFDYHLYTLARTTSVNNEQKKQITLLSAANVPLRKTYELRGYPDYYRSQTPDLGSRQKVGVFLSFENKGGELGIPLPAGTVRLYKAEAGGASVFIGGDRIDHTPKNESVRLHVGDAFDVTANRKQTNFHIVRSDETQSSYEITLRNAKREAVDVLVVEPIPGEWRVLDPSLPFVKSSSSSANWTVHVPANGSATLTYTADVTWW